MSDNRPSCIIAVHRGLGDDLPVFHLYWGFWGYCIWEIHGGTVGENLEIFPEILEN